jgi:uncharacterized membrane protein
VIGTIGPMPCGWVGWSVLVASEGGERLTIGGWKVATDVSEWIEILAIGVISAAVVVALVTAVRAALAGQTTRAAEAFKHQIGRGLLLGLDLLIAADIIRTVTLEPTLANVAALGLLVVVRTFLTWSLFLELEERWPWQRSVDGSASSDAPT